MRQASFLDAVKTVLSGAVGIRRKAAHERARVSPVHVVVAALLAVAAFVATLIMVVQIVLR